jgi:molybdopterin converting factor small subunit
VKRTILFFGRVRDAAGTPSIEAVLPAEVRDIPSLIAWIGADNDELGAALRGMGVRVAVDKAFVPSDAGIDDAGEIAFMAPLSGG